ncbi:homeobox CDX-1 [Brachionus plicatilis]|uniref:Homeobox CDX-1 n=1 Tax=Brachionus plicatilis TaxID=10195 RepID=A0A3M7S763_BRAPC|nr:homeobox CDX-1 [Brachionus plicatilis]
MHEILSSSPSMVDSSTPIDKDPEPSYYYGQNDFYYQNPAVAAAVLNQHYQYSNSAFSLNSLVEGADQPVLANQLHKPVHFNWQSTPNMSKNSSPNTNPTNTSSSSDSDYFNPAGYQEPSKYQQQGVFGSSRHPAPPAAFAHTNFYHYDQYQRQCGYYSSPKYEDMDVKQSKLVSSSPKCEQAASQALSSSSSCSFTSSPNSNKNTSTPTTVSSQNANVSSTSAPNAPPDSFEWMKPVKSAPNGKTRTKDKYRVVYSEPQRVELEKEFLFSKYITIKRKAELSQVLSLSERQIKIWFQNRRAKERKTNRKQKMSQQENVTSTTKSVKNEYSDDEMEEEYEESVNGDESNEAKSEMADKKSSSVSQSGLGLPTSKNPQCPVYPGQSFGQSQFCQPIYNQYSPANSYQGFYQSPYSAYQQSFQADYSGFAAPGQPSDFNQMAPVQHNFQFSNSDYLMTRPGSSSLPQPAVNSSNSIIQVLSQFQSI